ncbi:MAG TPA: DUF4382 domain-containing protein, partial [Agriterribacter sp.]|nr:DUF4382 domain-containing protein [Agriterribacter sp.]
YLTDSPADLDAVYLDIHSVEVKIDESNADDEVWIALQDTNDRNDQLAADGFTLWHGGIPAGDGDAFGKWIAVDFEQGIYDILRLRNGIDMLLGSVETAGTARKVRIALGRNNHVIKNEARLPLNLRDDSTDHHVYVNILRENRVINNDGNTAVYLDFDLGRSIFEDNGRYILFPCLRTLPADRSLELEGYVFPEEASIVVKVYNESDTVAALPDNDGYFKIRGLSLGRYSVQYDAGNNLYRDTTTVFDITKNKVILPSMTLNIK